MFKIPKEKFFITSDLHFQHKNLIKGCSVWEDKSGCRDFNTCEEYEELVINNINKIVPKDAYLISAGDIIFGNKENLPKILDRINCKNIIHVRGNHDDWFDRKQEYKNLFTKFTSYIEIVCGKQLICVFHYALKVWRDNHEGSWALTGHSHGSMEDDKNSLSLDVGVDTCLYGHVKYTPYSFEELKGIMSQNKKYTKIDHH